MAKRPLPTPELLRQLLDYDPKSGVLTWRERYVYMFGGKSERQADAICKSWNDRFADQEAFIGIDGAGYRQGTIKGHYLKAHRVAWAIHYGRWPDGEIDHINGDNQDNRIINMRDVSHADNLRNCRLSKANTSGVTGVGWDSRINKWIATIRYEGKTKRIGTFANFSDAVNARKRTAAEIGFHSGHGEVRTTPRQFVPTAER